jgi:hypothetical protein
MAKRRPLFLTGLALSGLVLVSFLYHSAHAAEAGAWAQPRGLYYAKVSSAFYAADEIYNDIGRRQSMGLDNDEFRGQQIFLYFEYGLLERLTLDTQARAGVLTAESSAVRRQTSGIGDVEVGLKYQLADRPFVLASMISGKLPTGYDARHRPALGAGKADGEVRLIASRSFFPQQVYIGTEVAYRLRGGRYWDQWSWSTEVGAMLPARISAKLFVNQTSTLEPMDSNMGVVNVRADISQGDCRIVGATAAFELIPGVSVEITSERTVAGENIGVGATWGLGLSMSR